MTPMFTLAYLLVPELADPSAQTATNSAIGSTYNLGAGAGAALAGILASALGPQWPFAAVALTTLLLIATASLLRATQRSAAEPASAP